MSKRIIKLTQPWIPPEVPSIPSIAAAPQVSGEQVILVGGRLQTKRGSRGHLCWDGSSSSSWSWTGALGRDSQDGFAWVSSGPGMNQLHLCFDVLKLISFISGQMVVLPSLDGFILLVLSCPMGFPSARLTSQVSVSTLQNNLLFKFPVKHFYAFDSSTFSFFIFYFFSPIYYSLQDLNLDLRQLTAGGWSGHRLHSAPSPRCACGAWTGSGQD